jgi:hypothetical protein
VRLAHEADNAARKRHASPQDRCDGSGDSDEEVGDGTAFGGGGSSPSLIDIIRPTKSGSKIGPEHFRRNSVGSSGKACRSTTCRPTML